MSKDPCVYIMASAPNGTLYIGVTSDLLSRVAQHRVGTFAGFTARYHCHGLVWFEQHGEMGTAIAREKQLKRWHRAWKCNLVERTNATWDDLGSALGLPPLAPRLGTGGP